MTITEIQNYLDSVNITYDINATLEELIIIYDNHILENTISFLDLDSTKEYFHLNEDDILNLSKEKPRNYSGIIFNYGFYITKDGSKFKNVEEAAYHNFDFII